MFFFKSNKNKKIISDVEILKVDEDFTNLSELLEYIEVKSGIHLATKKNILEERLKNFSRIRDIYSFAELIKNVKYNNGMWLDLMDLISTNETYFFRELKQIEHAIESLKDKKVPYDILSAPSSTGEEVYTIIILLLENGYDISTFNILGIDISTTTIDIAKKAVYDKRSLHRIPKNIIEKYFTQLNEKEYEVIDKVKNIANFRQLNIFDNDVLNIGKFDVIFSRNMFIYFEDDIKIKAYNTLNKLKKDTSSEIHLGHADLSSKLYKHIMD